LLSGRQSKDFFPSGTIVGLFLVFSLFSWLVGCNRGVGGPSDPTHPMSQSDVLINPTADPNPNQPSHKLPQLISLPLSAVQLPIAPP